MFKNRVKNLMDDCKTFINLGLGMTGTAFDLKTDEDVLVMKKCMKLMNDTCDLAVDMTEVLDNQNKTIELMYEEIKELRRLLEKES